ncbi:hypothetical protein H5410_023023 [Solanum commersonii]|uniref:Uncharacterized protein n=1 Tax=Solanum commersonii TaxID=4109 RepID=A0A9J5ZJW5_SOLCO|nr:hypothetical protein H5410_023023 [Solanum commersonii]
MLTVTLHFFASDHDRLHRSKLNCLLLILRHQLPISSVKLSYPRRNVRALGPCELLESMIGAYHICKRSREIKKTKSNSSTTNLVADKLVNPVGESSNHFGELSLVHQWGWLNN